MRNKKIYTLFCIIIVCLFNNIPYARGYSLRQFSSRNGLSNSAIQSICQDSDGFMWFGSCDGLNCFDGLNIEIYKPTDDQSTLSGNLIESIVEVENGFLWVQTNYGLDLFDKKKKQIHTYKDFSNKNYFAVSEGKDIFIINEDNSISYFDYDEYTFNKAILEDIPFENILDIVIDQHNILWVFTRDKNCVTYQIEQKGKYVQFIRNHVYHHPEGFLYVFHEGRKVYFVDRKYDFFQFEPDQMKTTYICNLSSQIQQKGEISSIISHHNDYYIGFKSSGLVWLKENKSRKSSYEISEIDIRTGIFCLVKDKYQDLIWVGTDGQGVFMYYIDSFSLRSHALSYLPYQVNNPVRSLFLDSSNDLWIGTKGDGIVRIKNYDPDVSIESAEVQHLYTGNSRLFDNSVYTLTESKRPLLWIGTEEGINYYSYTAGELNKLPSSGGERPVRYVHSICEVNDTTLWVATVGEGIVKVTLSGSAAAPEIKETKRFTIEGGARSSNYFFSSFIENDSIIWFGNRGYGAFRFNILTEEYAVYTFDENNNQTLNDVFSIMKNENGYWFGTSFGLVRLYEGKKSIFNESQGFPNNTVHSILAEDEENIWLSTNQGIIRFNTAHLTFQTFKEHHDMAVTEFSDGAFYKDEKSGIILFGGINGFLTIQGNEYSQALYMPDIHFTNLSIFGREYNIHDFLNRKRRGDYLELNYSQNFFSVSFTAIDYINGNDYSWFYKLDELSDNWIENGKSGSAAFTNISPGTYTLSVKYQNNITGEQSNAQSLMITILPPWYQTNTAYYIYCGLFLLGMIGMGKITRKWYEMKKSTMIEKLTRQQKEEVYESKLRFFTNITHELCTPLTLIYGPCERIISYARSDEYILKYATLVRQNVEKLNALIQELIEFRRLETGNMLPEIRNLSVSDVISNIANSFMELAETRGIRYEIRIPEQINWNSDPGCLNKIVTNLISNAFKYAPENGTVLVDLFEKKAGLCIEISNTGKGIPAERLTDIFDRYKILDTFEVESKRGLSSRNGLGLAICHSMVKLLDGTIEVESEPNEWTVFRVLLPPLQKNEEQIPIITTDTIPVVQEEPVTFDSQSQEFDQSKPTLMIVEDDPSMLWFITEIFVDKYNVMPLQDSTEVEEVMKIRQPDLVISDIMMPGVDGISLTRYIKENRLLSHIPVILLSARIDAEEQIRGIESGADVYITKPFNVEYLEKIVGRFLAQKKNLKEYYGSAASSYELTNGQLVHKEEKATYDKMIRIIDENINNPQLNVELISSSLGISTRQLYRRIKTVTEQTPSDIIKEYRLKTAEKLLITTNYSIDEILYKTGYVNRGNFFKVFSTKYGMTPKQYRKANQPPNPLKGGQG